jgi:hypothetical protein
LDVDYPTSDEAATPEYVMAVLSDIHRQQCQFDPEAERDASLGFDSTVEEWREACDLVDWRRLGRAHNQFWGIHCLDDQWRAALEPAREKRLRGVCELIAGSARRSRIRPARLLGRACCAAGAFLTVRSMLKRAGANAEKITPSTPLASYTREQLDLFLGPISRLAPGALPPVRVHTPVYDSAMWGMLAGLGSFALAGLVCCAGGRMSGLILALLGFLLWLVCYPLTWISARMLPKNVEFGDLRTFRDLAIVLAEAVGVEGPGPTAPAG